jgi:YesN/AraC family two-component response regulator
MIAIRPDFPVVICTGYSERINAEKARSMGIRGFLMKPVVKADLARVVREVLDAAG